MPLLKEIETLTRLHREGALTDSEYKAAKTAILEEVPDAQKAEPRGLSEGANLAARCVLPPIAIAGLVFALGIPAMLSLTLGVTIMAALVVSAWRSGDV